ncbi:hypothetical protein NESM_000285800 [Novymonas esmeraldas]|uniref:Uncharacterized protein n=1 Tax=Novymonas esmeraldas TaxID=1808958 RepID=A0AAW0F9Z6_9TRYP
MGAVPSRECTSLFSYFRGSYEVGMVPLTKYYFGNDTATADDAPKKAAAAGGDGDDGAGDPPLRHTDSRSPMRSQLRQQLLLMRRDPAVLYANARDADNILQSLSRKETGEQGSRRTSAGTAAAAAPTPPLTSKAASAATPAVEAAAGTTALSTAAAGDEMTPDASSRTNSPTGASDSDADVGASREHCSAGSAARLMDEYWSVMPDDNFSEEDLDRFLDLVDETLFDTNDALLAADPILPSDGSGAAAAAAAAAAGTHKPFMPVPCALCLAYPDGKERDGAFALDGRVINIIGYFGLMTQEMQDAFKVVKRLPSEAEAREQQQQQQQQQQQPESPTPLMFLNTAILTSAGDRTLERVLVLAAVMLRQQFHTIGRRHVLHTKLAQLVQLHDEALADSPAVRHLETLLAIPRAEEQPTEPFFDPLLEVPLPSIPDGIYTPTQYINAAANESPQRAHGSLADGGAPGAGAVDAAPSATCASLPQDAPASTDAHHSSACGADAGRVLLHPGQSASTVLGSRATGAPGGHAGTGANDVHPPPPPPPPPQQQQPMDGGGGAPLGTGAATPVHVLQPAGALPLSQADEDAITLALCRRMEQVRVVIETASNNYAALKSLTENFAFLHCQIMLDRGLTTMELIELPALVETPSFRPAAFATTAATTLRSAAAAGGTPATTTTEATMQLPPWSAVLIKLDPLHVRQATLWASSFFHCPTLLPSGGWVKYKLKDECEQLRHVLQNKDMLIAHWRKTDGEQADHYLGVHTGRLLEHVRALQAETEEARALSADYWLQRPLYVNQDGRKYALYESRYGTMLIGVRAFASTSSGAAAATSAKEDRLASIKAAPAGVSACGGVGSGSLPSLVTGTAPSLPAHTPPASAMSGSLHSIHSCTGGSGLTSAARSVAAPRVSSAGASHTSLLGIANTSHTSAVAPFTVAGSTNAPAPYAAPPFMHQPVYMPSHQHHHPHHHQHNPGGGSGGGIAVEPLSYAPTPAMPGYPTEMLSGFHGTFPHHQHVQPGGMPNPHISLPPHHRVGGGLPFSPSGWPVMPPPPPPHRPSVIPHVSVAQHGRDGVAGAGAFPFTAVTASPPPVHYRQVSTAAAGKAASPHPPSSMAGELAACTSAPSEAVPAEVARRSAPPTPPVTLPCPHGCIGAARCDGSATAAAAVSPSAVAVATPAATSAVGGEPTLQKLTELKSMMPWSLQGAAGWDCCGDDDTTLFLMRGAELLDVEEEEQEQGQEDEGGADDEVKKAPSYSTAQHSSRSNGGGGITDDADTQQSVHSANRMADGWGAFASGPAAHTTTQSAPTGAEDLSIMNLLLAAAAPPASSQQMSERPATSAVGAWHLTFPTVAEPRHNPTQAQPPAFQPGRVYPVYALQTPETPAQPHHQHQQQQQQQQQLAMPAAPPPGKPLYYTIANGVPLLVQPATTPGGMAIAYPIGQPFPHSGDAALPFSSSMPLPSPQQQQQQQQHQHQQHPHPQQQQQQMPIPHNSGGGAPLLSPSALDGRPMSRFSAQPGARWGGQYRFLSHGAGSLADAFANNMSTSFNSHTTTNNNSSTSGGNFY